MRPPRSTTWAATTRPAGTPAGTAGNPRTATGRACFPLGVGPILNLVRRRTDVTVVEARPRYYPRWCRFLIRLPGLRELLTWNLLVILRRQA